MSYGIMSPHHHSRTPKLCRWPTTHQHYILQHVKWNNKSFDPRGHTTIHILQLIKWHDENFYLQGHTATHILQRVKWKNKNFDLRGHTRTHILHQAKWKNKNSDLRRHTGTHILQQLKWNNKNSDERWHTKTHILQQFKWNNKNVDHDVWWAAGRFGGLKFIFRNKSNEITRMLIMMCGGPPAHFGRSLSVSDVKIKHPN